MVRHPRSPRRLRRLFACDATDGRLRGESARAGSNAIVGEAAGGSPHNYGDSEQVELEALGWTVHVPPQYVEVLGLPDERVSIEPDAPVQIGAADHFAGRDPVLAKAVALR